MVPGRATTAYDNHPASFSRRAARPFNCEAKDPRPRAFSPRARWNRHDGATKWSSPNSTLLWKTFHTIDNDDLLWISLTHALQVFQAMLKLVSCFLKAIVNFRLGCPASLFIRKFLEHHGWEKP